MKTVLVLLNLDVYYSNQKFLAIVLSENTRSDSGASYFPTSTMKTVLALLNLDVYYLNQNVLQKFSRKILDPIRVRLITY